MLHHIYDKYTPNDALIRQVGISFTKLTNKSSHQLSLFKDTEKDDENKALYEALDEVKEMYGKDSVLRASSLLKNSTAKERHNQIGGHRK